MANLSARCFLSSRYFIVASGGLLHGPCPFKSQNSHHFFPPPEIIIVVVLQVFI